MNKKIIIALVGKAGSGKDTVATKLAAARPDWNMIVSCTTRPMREGEQEGVNYFYLTNDEFAEKILNGDMLEATYFNSWHYGTMKSSLKDGVNVGVFNPEGFDCLTEMEIPGVTVMGYLIDCKDKTRMLRQLNREENPDVGEICRRYAADEDDFVELKGDPVYYKLDYCWNETLEDLEDIVSYIQNRTQHVVDVGHV